MSRDHVEIKRLAERLGELRSHLGSERPDASQVQALRRVLYGLCTLVAVHFAKEEEVYLPLLDTHLSPQEAKPLFETMEMAAQQAKNALR